jgi:hypothetical protein
MLPNNYIQPSEQEPTDDTVPENTTAEQLSAQENDTPSRAEPEEEPTAAEVEPQGQEEEVSAEQDDTDHDPSPPPVDQEAQPDPESEIWPAEEEPRGQEEEVSVEQDDMDHESSPPPVDQEAQPDPESEIRPDIQPSNDQVAAEEDAETESARDPPLLTVSPTAPPTRSSALGTLPSQDFMRKLPYQQFPSAIAACLVFIRSLPYLYMVTDPSLNSAECHTEVFLQLNRFPYLAQHLGLSESHWRSLLSAYIACCGKTRTLLFLDICKHLCGFATPCSMEITVFARAFHRVTHAITFAFELEQLVSLLREQEGYDWFQVDVASGTSVETLQTYVNGKVKDFFNSSSPRQATASQQLSPAEGF